MPFTAGRPNALRIAIVGVICGCASTTVDITGDALKQPICESGPAPLTAAVFWTTRWRPDQKEPALREAAALRGMQEFAGRTSCLSVSRIERLADPVEDSELRRLAGSTDRIILIVVRELGPKLTIGIPAIVEGGTEVVLDVRVLRASETLASSQTRWWNGGTFVIKGVKSLDHDMSEALTSTLLPKD
jgi:hypothetical protein